MQSDGNLVLYSAENEAMWASDTYGHDNTFVQYNDNGKLAIYKHATGGA